MTIKLPYVPNDYRLAAQRFNETVKRFKQLQVIGEQLKHQPELMEIHHEFTFDIKRQSQTKSQQLLAHSGSSRSE